MNYGKYIIIEYMGHEVPVIFSSLIPHNVIAENLDRRLMSAGFFEVGQKSSNENANDINVSCFGQSVTLKSNSRSVDETIIKKVLCGRK